MTDDDLPIKALQRFVNVDGQLLLMADRLHEAERRLVKSETEMRELCRRVDLELGHRQGMRDGRGQSSATLGWVVGVVGIALAIIFGIYAAMK